MFQRRAMVRQILLSYKALDLFAWCWKNHNGAFDTKLCVAMKEVLTHYASDKELADLLRGSMSATPPTNKQEGMT